MYHEYDSKEQQIADELTIKNMIEACHLPGLLSPEEDERVKQAVRMHILMNARKIEETFEEEISFQKTK